MARWCWCPPSQLPWRHAKRSHKEMNRDTMLVRTYLWCPPSGGYTPAHLGVTAGKWAELQACPALTLSLNAHVKWSSRTPHSSSDSLIKTRLGREDQGCQSSMKRFEEQLRSTSTNKRAEQEHLERKKKRLWERLRMSVKEKVISCDGERNVWKKEKSSWHKTERLIDGSLSHLVKTARHFY